jgi:hypothetical protein
MVYARADRDTGISRKVCRAGKAGCPAPPVVTEACVHFYFTLHARPSDAAGIRLSLRPHHLRREIKRTARAKPAARMIAAV